MVIKNHSAYLLQTAQTQIAMLLLNQFLRELLKSLSSVSALAVSMGRPDDGWIRVLAVHCGGFWFPCLQAAAVKPM